MLQYKKRSYLEHKGMLPPLAVLLSCYDELATEAPPGTYCGARLPMFAQYLSSNWPKGPPAVFWSFALGAAVEPYTAGRGLRRIWT